MGAFVSLKIRGVYLVVCLLWWAATLYAQDGGLDLPFAPALNGAVHSMSMQSDGKILVAGDFTLVNGVSRGRVARLNSDGSLDATFGANLAGANGSVRCIVQAGGKIYLAGNFTAVSGFARNRVVRLNPDGSVDSTFNPGTGANAIVHAIVVNPFTSTVTIGGEFTAVSGSSRNRIARLTATGSLDASSFTGSGVDGTVYTIAYDPGSRATYIGGAFTSIDGYPVNRVAKLRDSGSLTLDWSFNTGPAAGPNGDVYCISLRASSPTFGSAVDLLIGGAFTAVGGTACGRVALLDASLGQNIASFSVTADDVVRCSLAEIKDPAEGATEAMWIAGDFHVVNGVSCNGIARLSSLAPYMKPVTATLDATFDPGSGADSSVRCMAPETDGKLLIGGLFAAVDNTARGYFARLCGKGGSTPPAQPSAPIVGAGTDTTLALVWSPVPYTSGFRLERSADGISGWVQMNSASFGFSTVPFFDAGRTPGTSYFYRLVAYSTNGDSEASPVSMGRTLATPWKAAGIPDTDFISRGGSGPDGSVSAVAVQQDDKTLVGGLISSFNGTRCSGLVRLLRDGSLDPAFNLIQANFQSPEAFAIGADGKIVVGGSFTRAVNGNFYGVIRLNADGSSDATFSPVSTDWWLGAIAVQSDGKIVLAGYFTTAAGLPRNGIARLNQDGSVDPTFNPPITSADIHSVAIQPDGKVIIGGVFKPADRSRTLGVARLNTDGSIDPSFEQRPGTPGAMRSLVLQQDGRIIAAGLLRASDGMWHASVARLLADGSIDTTFNAGLGDAGSEISSAAVQKDGKVVIGGSFMTFAGTVRLRIARLNADGSLDSTFMPGLGVDDDVHALGMEADGKCIAGGLFSKVNGIASKYLTRFLADNGTAAPGSPASFTAAPLSSHAVQLSWAAVPFSSGYKIMQSPNGTSEWIEIGSPAAGATTFTVDSLPNTTSVYFRLQPYSSNGNVADWVTAGAATYSLYQQWKLDSGLAIQAADEGDPDGDGIPNLMEYALGSAPNVPSLDAMPDVSVNGASLTLSYSKLRPDLTYTVETSSDLNSWTTQGVNQGGAGPGVTASTPLDFTASKFLRLRVTRP